MSNEFDWEAALITTIIQDKDMRAVIRQKITRDFFYTQQGKAAFIFLMSWYENPDYGDTPSWESFQHHFPGFEPQTCEESIVAICDKVREQRLYQDLASVLQEVANETRGNPKQGMEILKKQAARLVSEHQIDSSRTMTSMLDQLRSEYDAMKAGGVHLKGYSWPWPALNDATLGFQRGQLAFLYARPKSGKAQPLWSSVLTPDGWTTMGNIRVGSEVIGADGHPHRVVGVYPQGSKPIYRVTMSDGTHTVCCDEHLWFTTTHLEARRGQPGRARPLHEIRQSLRAADGRANHRVPVVEPVHYSQEQDLPLDPWLLGALLGDGSMTRTDVTFCKPEADLMQRVVDLLPPGDTAVLVESEERAAALRIKRLVRDGEASSTATALRHLRLLGSRSHEKFIPVRYLHASPKSRLLLLQGLLDTDGSVTSGVAVEYSTSSAVLGESVAELARSLGALVTATTKETHYVLNGERYSARPSHRLSIRFPDGTCPVTSEKHLAKWKAKHRPCHRTIESVEPLGTDECQCIAIDSDDHLYVTDQFIVTHNTWMGLEVIRNLHQNGLNPLIISQELSTIEIARRFVALSCNVDYSAYLRGELTSEAEETFGAALEAFAEQPPVIIDMLTSRGDAAVTELAAKVDEYKANVVLVDGVYFLGEDWKELSRVTRGFKRIAREKDIPILGTTQQNRKKDTGGEGQDVGYSDTFLQDCDLLLKVTREPQHRSKHQAMISVAAIREGTGVAFLVNMRLCEDLTQGDVLHRDDGADEGEGAAFDDGVIDDGNEEKSE